MPTATSITRGVFQVMCVSFVWTQNSRSSAKSLESAKPSQIADWEEFLREEFPRELFPAEKSAQIGQTPADGDANQISGLSHTQLFLDAAHGVRHGLVGDAQLV